MVMRIMVLVALLGHSSVANSQYGVTYPVDINAMLTPPYGTCLTDYVGTNRFQCNVLMRDMHATGYKFRILMTVKDMASGRVMFSAQSDQHTVTPGKPVYMAEIGVFSEFFKAGNILSSTAYRDGCLNEGAYNFVFQVVDDNDKRRIPISKECVFPARLQAGGAPLLISPFTGTNIDCNQTIVNFSWQMPVVTGEQTKYLIEICPTDEGGNGLHYLGSYTPSANGSGPSQGYIHATSYMPMYQLIETEGMKLVPNTTYFWRVSIIDEFGNVKPNSTSEIDSFTYCYTKELEPYTPLKEPKVKAINGELDTVHIDTVKTEDNATKATWFLDDVRFKYQSYALDIRKKSQDTWTTYHIKINEGDTEEKNYYGLSNLKYNEPYEARMQYLLITDNDTSYAPFSDTITFVVPNPMDTADCGEIMAIKDCNGEKGKILKKYDTLYANGTPVVLDSIIYKAGDSTVISGFGVVSFPILRNFKLKMSFNEVSVNCYGELVSGQVVSVYNESTGAIIDLNHSTGKGDGGGSQSTNERPDPTSYKDENEAKEKMQTGEYAKIGDFIYTKDKDGNVVALGKTLSIPAEKYTNNNTLDDDDVYCIFRNDTKDAPYIGFDADEHKYYRGRPTLGDHYTPTFSKQDGADFEYIIPYVASNPGRVVKLSATLEGRLTDEYDKESLKFIMPMSGGDYLELNAKKEGDKFIVDFPGGKNPDTNSDVYAIVKKGEKYVNVGKINIETYAWRTQKVKIVPVVNDYGVDENAISETLNRIYGRFGITYEVSKDDRFESENINSEFLDNFSVSSGTFTKQSDDMKRLQYYYKTERGIQDSTAYIFLLKSAVDYPTIDGDMPQGQICGYIFMHSDNGTLSDGRLVAHELAHGIYRLDHVFEKAYKIPENSTDNLLDYNNGDQLAHFQWELIKKPGFAWALLESDEENFFDYDQIRIMSKQLNSLYELYKVNTDEVLLIHVTPATSLRKYIQSGGEFVMKMEPCTTSVAINLNFSNCLTKVVSDKHLTIIRLKKTDFESFQIDLNSNILDGEQLSKTDLAHFGQNKSSNISQGSISTWIKEILEYVENNKLANFGAIFGVSNNILRPIKACENIEGLLPLHFDKLEESIKNGIGKKKGDLTKYSQSFGLLNTPGYAYQNIQMESRLNNFEIRFSENQLYSAGYMYDCILGTENYVKEEIENFSKNLLDGIYRCGEKDCPNNPERIKIIQDKFKRLNKENLTKEEFNELENLVSITCTDILSTLDFEFKYRLITTFTDSKSTKQLVAMFESLSDKECSEFVKNLVSKKDILNKENLLFNLVDLIDGEFNKLTIFESENELLHSFMNIYRSVGSPSHFNDYNTPTDLNKKTDYALENNNCETPISVIHKIVNHFGIILNDKETIIDSLLLALPKSCYTSLFDSLVVRNGNKSDYSFLENLIGAIDDVGIPLISNEDNYTELMSILLRYYCISGYYEKMVTKNDEFNKHVYYLAPTDYITSELKKLKVNSVITEPGYYEKYKKAEIYYTGKYYSKIHRIKINRVITFPWYENMHDDVKFVAELDPLAPVCVTRQSNYSLVSLILDDLSELSKNGSDPLIVPSILFKHAYDKDRNKKLEDIFYSALDVATLFTGIGEIRLAATTFQRFWATINYAGAISDLVERGANTAFNYKYTESNNDLLYVLNKFNTAMGYIGIGQLAWGSGKWIFKSKYDAKTFDLGEVDLESKRKTASDLFNEFGEVVLSKTPVSKKEIVFVEAQLDILNGFGLKGENLSYAQSFIEMSKKMCDISETEYYAFINAVSDNPQIRKIIIDDFKYLSGESLRKAMADVEKYNEASITTLKNTWTAGRSVDEKKVIFEIFGNKLKDTPIRKRFANDFVGVNDVLSEMIKYPELVDVWLKLGRNEGRCFRVAFMESLIKSEKTADNTNLMRVHYKKIAEDDDLVESMIKEAKEILKNSVIK